MNRRVPFRAVAIAGSIGAVIACGGTEVTELEDLGSTTSPLVSPRYEKRFLAPEDAEAVAGLRRRGGVLEEFDYNGFRMVVLDREQLTYSLPGEVREDLNHILLNGYTLDTTRPERTYDQLPADLRAPRLRESLAQGRAPPAGLYLIQFVGPVQSYWSDSLRKTGVEIVSYQPENAYVVRASTEAAARLVTFARQRHVQFLGDYEPAFRLTPQVMALRQSSFGQELELTVQVADGPNLQGTLAALRGLATGVLQAHQVDRLWNVQLKARAEALTAIARLPEVFNVEPRAPRERLDETQAQIVAGNLQGNLPTGPGYLNWLSGKGFSSTQFTGFVVNVVDDAYSLSGHPDLPTSRIAFEHNPTSQSGAQGGHGFLNAHIVAGYNDLTGFSYEDGNGNNYGLGIAPWARVGATAIFGPGSSSPTQWESLAYDQSARISANPWGHQGVHAYNSQAQEYDRIVRDAHPGLSGSQQLAVVFAAGNDGAAGTIRSPATAKNVITVGASENVRRTGTDGCGIDNVGADNANDISAFSSRGPVNTAGGDGRIKPDLVAPGSHIQAGIPQSNYSGASVCNPYWPSGSTLYALASGSSHSSSAVAGGAALLYQDFLNKGRPAPSPAMLKAYLVSSAAYMTGASANDTLPSNNQGMGRMELNRAFDNATRRLVDQTHVLGNTGDTYILSGSIDSSALPFRVTLAWSDAPGSTTGAPWVNNLDLEVKVNDVIYRGNVFSGANSVSGGSSDPRNNVESVFLPAGLSGRYTITVRATNLPGDGVPDNADASDQDFALVVYNGNDITGELLQNGNFEAGTANPWVLSGNSYYSTNPVCFPQSGTGYNFQGGLNSAVGSTYQEISIPTGTNPSLTYGLRISSEEGTSTAYDKFYVQVLNTSGSVLKTLAICSNLDKVTMGSYVQRGPFSLAEFAGQTVRIQFRTDCNSSNITTFRIDNVAVQ